MHMPFPLKVLIWIVLFMGSLGLLVGMLNIMNPQAVYIPSGVDGSKAVGLEGVIASTVSSLTMGLILGIPAAFLTWLVGPKRKAAPDNSNEVNETE